MARTTEEKSLRVTITLTRDVLEMADEAAAELGINRSMFIALAIREKVRQEETRKNMPAMLMQMAQMMQMVTDLDKRGLLNSGSLPELPALDQMGKV